MSRARLRLMKATAQKPVSAPIYYTLREKYIEHIFYICFIGNLAKKSIFVCPITVCFLCLVNPALNSLDKTNSHDICTEIARNLSFLYGDTTKK